MAAADFWSALGAALQGGEQGFQQATSLEQQRKKQAIELAVLQQNATLAQRREGREVAADKAAVDQQQFGQAMALRASGGTRPMTADQAGRLPQSIRDTVVEKLPSTTSAPALLDKDGAAFDPADNITTTNPVNHFQFTPTESEKVRVADANRQAAAARFATSDATRREHDQQTHDDKMAGLAQANSLAQARIMAAALARQSLSNPQEIAAVDRLNSRYSTATKSQQQIVDAYSNMAQAFDAWKTGKVTDKGATGQTMITSFNKILDPTSVVRESEYARTPEGLGLMNRLSGMAERITSGGPGVPDNVLQDYLTTAKLFHDRAVTRMAGEQKRVKMEAEHYHLPMELIITDDAATAGPATPSTAAPGAAPAAAPLSPYQQYLQRSGGK